MYFNKFSIFFVILCMFCSYIYAQPKPINSYVDTEFVEFYGANSLVQFPNDIDHEQIDNTTRRLGLHVENETDVLRSSIRRVDAGFRNGWINPVNIPSTINQSASTRINITLADERVFEIHAGDVIILSFYQHSAIVFVDCPDTRIVTVIANSSGIHVSVFISCLPRLACLCRYNSPNINIPNLYYMLDVMINDLFEAPINERELIYLINGYIELMNDDDLQKRISVRSFLLNIIQRIIMLDGSQEKPGQLAFINSMEVNVPIIFQLLGEEPNHRFSIFSLLVSKFPSYFYTQPEKRVDYYSNRNVINFLVSMIKSVNL